MREKNIIYGNIIWGEELDTELNTYMVQYLLPDRDFIIGNIKMFLFIPQPPILSGDQIKCLKIRLMVSYSVHVQLFSMFFSSGNELDVGYNVYFD